MQFENNIRKKQVPIIEWIFILFWCKDILVSYFLQIYKRLPIIGVTEQAVLPLVFAVMAIVAMFIRFRVKLFDLIFITVVMILSAISAICYPDAAKVELPQFLLTVFPMFFVGLYLDKDALILKKYSLLEILYILSVFNIASEIAYIAYFLSSRTLETYSMTWAYNTLPSLLIIMYWSIRKKSVVATIIALAGFSVLLSFGTRGPIVCLLIFVLVHLLYVMYNRKTRIFLFILFFGLIIAIQHGLLVSAAKGLRDVVASIGLSTRFFDLLLNKKFLYSSGRDTIQQALFYAISQKPLLGYGVFADRYLASSGVYESGMYAHNIAIEMWIQFGIIIGSAMLLTILILLVMAVRRATESPGRQGLLWIFICTGFVKLFMSGSYLLEPYFFLMIGYCIRIIREKNIQEMRYIHENPMAV